MSGFTVKDYGKPSQAVLFLYWLGIWGVCAVFWVGFADIARMVVRALFG